VTSVLVLQGYAGGDESKMLQRRLADTTTKLGIGANRAAVASSMLQKYGYVDPCEAFLQEKLSSAPSRVVNGTSAKIGVAILDDGMQVSSICGFFLS
jgi:tetraacyldisaccharide 4'-kinase